MGHQALIYRDREEFVSVVAPFLRDGLGAGERGLVVLTDDRLSGLRAALGSDLDRVEVIDAAKLYGRLGSMFHTLAGLVGDRVRPVRRLVAENVLVGRGHPEARAYQRYEAVATLALGDAAEVLCPYQATLPRRILDGVHQTHATTTEGGVAADSGFVDPQQFLRRRVDLPGLNGASTVLPLRDTRDLSGARATVRDAARAAGLPPAAVVEFVTAVGEAATNALLHGRHPRTLRTLAQHPHLVCQVCDSGPGLSDPLAGYLRPDGDTPGGRGLWLIHQLCDLVEVDSGPTGTTIQMRMRLQD